MIILIILIILVLLSFNLFRNLFKNDATVLDDVKLKISEPSNNGFALMLEQDDGTYEESTSSTWPTDMVFNSEKSGCIDINGNKIEDALEYDSTNNIMNVSIGETAYCYVYFDNFCKEGENLSNCIVKNSNKGVEEIWNSTLDGDGYRYVGTNPSNYICFGTTDKDICLNDTDKYIYRIIGVFEDSEGNKHAKLIKKEALNTAYTWNSNYKTNVGWDNSTLYQGINGSYFLSNEYYPYMQDSSWVDKITTWNYTMTNTKVWENYRTNLVHGPYYSYVTVKTMYLHELNKSGKSSETCYYDSSTIADCNAGEWKTLNTKIGLMYASDYALSLGSASLSYTSSSNSSTMKIGWMLIFNNDGGTPSTYEWTMSCLGDYGNGDYYAWNVHPNGNVGWHHVSNPSAVRPTFFLTSNVEYSSGTGTITDPFLIAE